MIAETYSSQLIIINHIKDHYTPLKVWTIAVDILACF